jgi:hypothetical protein
MSYIFIHNYKYIVTNSLHEIFYFKTQAQAHLFHGLFWNFVHD